MCRPAPKHRLSVLLACLCLACPPMLAACTASPAPPASTDAGTSAEPASPDVTDTPASLVDRIVELQATLQALKAERYIEAAAYEARIRELEAAILALGGRLPPSQTPSDSSAADRTDRPNTGDPSVDTGTTHPQPPNESTAPGDQAPLDPSGSETTPPAATAAYHYGLENGGAVIYAYRGTATVVRIPATIGGYPVTRIHERAFAGTSVHTITIPDTVTEIGWFAFADCPALSTVTLPASVARIGYDAFAGSPLVTLVCPADSYAAAYAASFGIAYRAG